MDFLKQLIVLIVSGIFGGAALVAAVTSFFKYLKDRPLTKATAKKMNTELGMFVVQKVEEYNARLEKRLANAEAEIDSLRKKLFDLELENRKLRIKLEGTMTLDQYGDKNDKDY